MTTQISDSGILFNDQTTIGSAYNLGPRNKIINGGMVVDQRNSGAAVTHTGTNNVYGMDRFVFNSTGTPQFSVQRVVDAPAGFVYSAKITTTTAGTPAAGDFSYFGQYIEGFNVADLNFGTANAKTVTLSFWVKSSLTGTFGGALKNGTPNRSYVFSFTIAAANTWQYVAVTIAGDTTGTWATDNTAGLFLVFDTGTGTTNKTTAGSWGANTAIGVTGGVNLVATAAATLNITGVQLEVGSTATPFEVRDYGDVLRQCQRYYEVGGFSAENAGYATGVVRASTSYKVNKRNATPTITPSFAYVNASGGSIDQISDYGFRATATVTSSANAGFSLTWSSTTEL